MNGGKWTAVFLMRRMDCVLLIRSKWANADATSLLKLTDCISKAIGICKWLTCRRMSLGDSRENWSEIAKDCFIVSGKQKGTRNKTKPLWEYLRKMRVNCSLCSGWNMQSDYKFEFAIAKKKKKFIWCSSDWKMKKTQLL